MPEEPPDEAAAEAQRMTQVQQTAAAYPQPAPAGSGEYIAGQGESILSIACQAGHFWETLWNDPGNASLKAARKDPDTLLPGDRVTVPPLRAREEPAATDQHHCYVRRGVPAVLRMRLLDDKDRPRKHLRYTAQVDGRVQQGLTDANGSLTIPIPPDARGGVLLLPDTGEEYPLLVGHLDPIDSISGVQARLNHLGFDCGPADGILGPQTQDAIRCFQAKRGMAVSGAPDAATRQALASEYGC